MSPFCRTEKMLLVHPSHLICILVRIPAMYIDPPPPSLLTIVCILVCSQPVYSNRDSLTKHCKDQENQWREGRVSISRGMVIIACPMSMVASDYCPCPFSYPIDRFYWPVQWSIHAKDLWGSDQVSFKPMIGFPRKRKTILLEQLLNIFNHV